MLLKRTLSNVISLLNNVVCRTSLEKNTLRQLGYTFIKFELENKKKRGKRDLNPRLLA